MTFPQETPGAAWSPGLPGPAVNLSNGRSRAPTGSNRRQDQPSQERRRRRNYKGWHQWHIGYEWQQETVTDYCVRNLRGTTWKHIMARNAAIPDQQDPGKNPLCRGFSLLVCAVRGSWSQAARLCNWLLRRGRRRQPGPSYQHGPAAQPSGGQFTQLLASSNSTLLHKSMIGCSHDPVCGLNSLLHRSTSR